MSTASNTRTPYIICDKVTKSFGAHQVLNALPAIYAAKALGLSEEEILAGLAHIEKTGMRNDVIAVRQGWILDDSYKSNRQSALAALKTLHDFDVPRRVAALSDMLDMGEAGPMLHYAVGKAVAEYGIDRCFASSEIGDALLARMYGKSYKPDCTGPARSSATCGGCTATSQAKPCWANWSATRP